MFTTTLWEKGKIYLCRFFLFLNCKVSSHYCQSHHKTMNLLAYTTPIIQLSPVPCWKSTQYSLNQQETRAENSIFRTFSYKLKNTHLILFTAMKIIPLLTFWCPGILISIKQQHHMKVPLIASIRIDTRQGVIFKSHSTS